MWPQITQTLAGDQLSEELMGRQNYLDTYKNKVWHGKEPNFMTWLSCDLQLCSKFPTQLPDMILK